MIKKSHITCQNPITEIRDKERCLTSGLNAQCRVNSWALTLDMDSPSRILPENVFTCSNRTTGTRIRQYIAIFPRISFLDFRRLADQGRPFFFFFLPNSFILKVYKWFGRVAQVGEVGAR